MPYINNTLAMTYPLGKIFTLKRQHVIMKGFSLFKHEWTKSNKK